MDAEVIFTLEQIPIPRRVDAVDPSKLDPIAVRNQKPRSRSKAGNSLNREPVFVVCLPRIKGLQALISSTKYKRVFLIGINVLGVRLGDLFPLIPQPKSGIDLLTFRVFMP
jgi:hypothetical protein